MSREVQVRFCESVGVRFSRATHLVLLHDDKSFLKAARSQIEGCLAGLGLKLHPNKTQVFPVSQGVDFLGFKTFPSHRRLNRANFYHFRRKLGRMRKDYQTGRVGLDQISASIRSWTAHASWGDTWGLRSKLFEEAAF